MGAEQGRFRAVGKGEESELRHAVDPLAFIRCLAKITSLACNARHGAEPLLAGQGISSTSYIDLRERTFSSTRMLAR